MKRTIPSKIASYICEGCLEILPPFGKITAQGRVEIFPKSSPFIKFAILPRKRPIGATQATISENLKKL